jgi:hypothetical protein
LGFDESQSKSERVKRSLHTTFVGHSAPCHHVICSVISCLLIRWYSSCALCAVSVTYNSMLCWLHSCCLFVNNACQISQLRKTKHALVFRLLQLQTRLHCIVCIREAVLVRTVETVAVLGYLSLILFWNKLCRVPD